MAKTFVPDFARSESDTSVAHTFAGHETDEDEENKRAKVAHSEPKITHTDRPALDNPNDHRIPREHTPEPVSQSLHEDIITPERAGVNRKTKWNCRSASRDDEFLQNEVFSQI